MSKKVIFHVGLPKTGTTTVQQYLRRQDEKLRSVGFLYPGPREREVMRLSINHPLMFNAMVGKIIGPSEGLDVEGCREVIQDVFRKFHESEFENLIWSYEGMGLAARMWDADYLAHILNGADVRIVCFVRYMDDWVDSLNKEQIWAQAARRRTEDNAARPLRAVAPSPGAAKPPLRSLLENCATVIRKLAIIRNILPSAEILVRSFDASREKGRVVSDALAAMGAPVEVAFPDADEEAGIKNPTKSDLYSMLLYHLAFAEAGGDVIRGVAGAARKRDRRGVEFAPLAGRRFRFLSDENIIRARGYYEELREEYPDLPAQPPFVSNTAARRLPRDEGVALLEWLRPDIADDIFEMACAAYPDDPAQSAIH